MHPAVFPSELAVRVIQYYSFKEDLVFDPFGGSGTVGHAALMNERHFFLCERETEYVDHAMQMLDKSLFSGFDPRLLSLTELKSQLAEEAKKQ